MALFNDVVIYQRFGGPCCLHLQGEEIGNWSGHKYRADIIRGDGMLSGTIGGCS
jgi:hypothetical protein